MSRAWGERPRLHIKASTKRNALLAFVVAFVVTIVVLELW